MTARPGYPAAVYKSRLPSARHTNAPLIRGVSAAPAVRYARCVCANRQSRVPVHGHIYYRRQAGYGQSSYGHDKMRSAGTSTSLLSALLLLALGHHTSAQDPSYPTPRGALLVLPAPQPATTSTAAPPPANKSDDSSSSGSPLQGQINIFYPDGSLRRVQYSTSQPASSDNQPQNDSSSSGSQDGAGAQGRVFYVQVPQARLQPVLAPGPSPPAQDGVQQDPNGSNTSSSPAADLLALTVVTADQLSSALNQAAANQNQDPGNQNQDPAGQNQVPPGQDGASQPASPAITVRLAEVKPISGPVYSYSPSSLVRILRGTYGVMT